MCNRSNPNVTAEERNKIEALHKYGASAAAIARELHRGKRTIYRELAKGCCICLTSELIEYKSYGAAKAQSITNARSRNRANPIKLGHDYKLSNFIIEQMDGKTSPIAVSQRIKDNKQKFTCTVSPATLYTWIHRGYLGIDNKKLPQGKRKRSYQKVKHLNLKNPLARSISERPAAVNDRDTFGHWEMDTVIGNRNGKNAVLLVLSERLTRFEIIIKMQYKIANCTVFALDELYREAGADFTSIFKTITVDNGGEFSDSKGIEKDGRTTLYYCHPFSSWERGTNENINKMIRRHIPKGESINPVSVEKVNYIQNWINDYPRKILGWQTAKQRFLQELSKEGIDISNFA